MRYLGGKSKIARRLTDVILSATPYRARLLEPFVGGGAMTAVLAPHFNEVAASDIHEDLILMWQALKDGWTPPSEISLETYEALRRAAPSPERGFAGFGGASFGGKWFGGYARGAGRNYADESARSLLRDIKSMGNVTFRHAPYAAVTDTVTAGDVVYSDPPYADTTGYRDPFRPREFWESMRNCALRGAAVFVSEYKAPADWESIYEVTRTRDLKSKLTNAATVTEKLFTYRPQPSV